MLDNPRINRDVVNEKTTVTANNTSTPVVVFEANMDEAVSEKQSNKHYFFKGHYLFIIFKNMYLDVLIRLIQANRLDAGDCRSDSRSSRYQSVLA